VQEARAAIQGHKQAVLARLPPPRIEASKTISNQRDMQVRTAGRKNVIALCTFDVAQSVLYLMRASLGITAAVRDCQESKISATGQAGQMLCSVDVSGLITSFAWATASISLTVARCPVGGNLDAMCSFDIAAAVGVVAGIATSGSSFKLTCGGLAKTAFDLGRRLEGNETATAGPLAPSAGTAV